jgi:hypothetical protein
MNEGDALSQRYQRMAQAAHSCTAIGIHVLGHFHHHLGSVMHGASCDNKHQDIQVCAKEQTLEQMQSSPEATLLLGRSHSPNELSG